MNELFLRAGTKPIKNIMQSNIPCEAVTYKSIDTVVEANEAAYYPTESLNLLDQSGMPTHVMQLKIGVPLIMLRNYSPTKLCDGTRLAVKALMSYVEEATI